MHMYMHMYMSMYMYHEESTMEILHTDHAHGSTRTPGATSRHMRQRHRSTERVAYGFTAWS